LTSLHRCTFMVSTLRLPMVLCLATPHHCLGGGRVAAEVEEYDRDDGWNDSEDTLAKMAMNDHELETRTMNGGHARTVTATLHNNPNHATPSLHEEEVYITTA